ncbi:MAG: M48 family metallopeptidase [Hyphomicrobiaceae bacterium]|nr:MAG: M48 family metallopeptidase [Hyphomicrobiaceae bacterium]
MRLNFLANVRAPRAASLSAGMLAAVLLLVQTGAAEAQLGFIRDTEIESLLDDYSKPIFKVAGLGQQPIRVRIVQQDGFNAFVVDGQNVFINSGTLMMSKTPNQVIGVIAHETGHIAGGHLAKLRQRIKEDQTKALVLKVLAVGAMIAGSTQNNSSRDGLIDAGKGIFVGGDQFIIRGLLLYQRQHESAADQAGIGYLTQTKQSGAGMLATFEEFAKQEYLSAQFQDPYVRSHPMARDRIAQLRRLAESSPYFATTDLPALQLRHDLMRAKLVGFLSRGNPKIVYNQFPASDRSLPARYARAIAKYFTSDINAALPEIEALIRERPDYPYFHELKGELLLRSGRAKEAVPPYRKALSLVGGTASLIRIDLAKALLQSGDPKGPDEAIDLIRKAVVLENDNPDAFQTLANAYYKKGLEAEANLSVAQARFLVGNLPEAKSFAKRAQLKLAKNTPSWLRADDIINFNPPKE